MSNALDDALTAAITAAIDKSNLALSFADIKAHLTAAVTVPVNSFPADPGSAPFPSPENSNTLRLGATITGAPYLRDDSGAVHQLVPVVGLVTGYLLNGVMLHLWSNEITINSIIMRGGHVYAQQSGGQWGTFDTGTGSMEPAGLPPTETAPVAGAPKPPADAGPVPSPVAPGSSGRVLTVGAGGTYATITDAVKAALAGDTISVAAGAYPEAPPALTVPLLLLATGPVVMDMKGLTGNLARGKAALVPCADTIIRGPWEIKNTAMDQEGAQATSAIRPDAGCGFLLVDGANLHDNQQGVGSGAVNVAITLRNVTLTNNGLPPGNSGNGYTHNVYVSGGTYSLTLDNVTSVSPQGGHAIKSRAPRFLCTGGTFDASDATIFDLCNGTSSVAQITGATFTKPGNSANHGVIGYAAEGASNGLAGMIVSGGTINCQCDNPWIGGLAGAIITVDPSVVFKGTKPTAMGSTVIGL